MRGKILHGRADRGGRWSRPLSVLLLTTSFVAIGITVAGLAPGPAQALSSGPAALVTSCASGNSECTLTAVDVSGTALSLEKPIKLRTDGGSTLGIGWQVDVTPDGRTAFITGGPGGDRMEPVNLATGTPGALIQTVESTPEAMAPNGLTDWAVTGGVLSAVDVASDTVVATVPYPDGYWPENNQSLAVSPDSPALYIEDQYGNIWRVDTDTDVMTELVTIPSAGSDLGPMEITPDGTKLYVIDEEDHDLVAVNTDTLTITSIPIPGAETLSITPNGETALVGTDSGMVQAVDTSDDSLLTESQVCTVGYNVQQTTVTPNGATGVVACDDNSTPDGSEVVSLDISTMGAGDPVEMPGSGQGTGRTINGITIVPDQAPTAALAVTPAPAGSATTFDASGSVQSQYPITSYAWNFGDGDQTTTSSPTVSHTYTSSGTYTATVTETDAAGTSTAFVTTGQSDSQSGSSAAIASNTFTITQCSAGSSCSANIGSSDQTVAVSGSSSTNTSLTLSDTLGTLSCGKKYAYPATIAKLSESDFTSAAGLSVTVEQGHQATAKGVKICYQPDTTPPSTAALLKKCSSKVSAPCYSSITEASGSVVAKFTVPAGDPRFWVGGGAVELKKFSPTSGPPGTTVKITGKSLGAVDGVTFGGNEVAGTNLQIASSGKSLTVTVPSAALSGSVDVVTDGGIFASSVAFTVN